MSGLHSCDAGILKSHRYFIGWLCVGINSSLLAYFAIAFLSQWWLRTRYPRWFAQYNYIVGAGEFRQLVILRADADSWDSSRWGNPSDGVHPLLCSTGCSRNCASFPKLVGRKPRWELRPLCIPDVVDALVGQLYMVSNVSPLRSRPCSSCVVLVMNAKKAVQTGVIS